MRRENPRPNAKRDREKIYITPRLQRGGGGGSGLGWRRRRGKKSVVRPKPHVQVVTCQSDAAHKGLGFTISGGHFNSACNSPLWTNSKQHRSQTSWRIPRLPWSSALPERNGEERRRGEGSLNFQFSIDSSTLVAGRRGKGRVAKVSARKEEGDCNHPKRRREGRSIDQMY